MQGPVRKYDRLYRINPRWCALCVVCILLAAIPLSGRQTFSGRSYWSVQELAQHLGMQHGGVTAAKQVTLKSRWSSLQFTEHQRIAKINGTACVLGFPVILWQGDLHISDSDYQKTIRPLLLPKTIEGRRKLYRIVIDPGHGGRDSGAISKTYQLSERVLSLTMAQKLQKKLQALGYDVHLTRQDQSYISLRQRAAYANHLQADLFISIHGNGASDSRVKGVETYVFTPQNQPSSGRNLISSDSRLAPGNENDDWSVLAGYALQGALLDAVKPIDRGLKRARFEALKHLQVPGVLVELGFLSNPEEAKRLGNIEYQARLVDGLVEGVLRYQRVLNEMRKES